MRIHTTSYSSATPSPTTVSDEKAMITAAAALDPHFIITDISTKIGLDAFRRLEAMMPDVKIIVLSDQEKPELVEAALAAGASAFLIKNEGPDLCGKIRAVVRDLLVTHPKRLTGEASAQGTDCTLIEKRSGLKERRARDAA